LKLKVEVPNHSNTYVTRQNTFLVIQEFLCRIPKSLNSARKQIWERLSYEDSILSEPVKIAEKLPRNCRIIV
jgi:hypothetical protein